MSYSNQAKGKVPPAKGRSPMKSSSKPSDVPRRTPNENHQNMQAAQYAQSMQSMQSMQYMPMEQPSYFAESEMMMSGGGQDIKYTNVGDFSEGESIRVALRVRPMNRMETSRGDENCVKVLNDTTIQLGTK